MKTVILLGFIFIFSLLIVVTGSNIIQNVITNEITEENSYNDCKNFNGREFLLTGGTGTPETAQEINLEVRRLNWLCNGGVR